MAITSEIIGKLGGADVKVMPVEGIASGKSGSSEVIATIDAPAGETWLVAAIGQVAPAGISSSYYPDLHLGGVSKLKAGPDETHGLAATVTGSISFTIKRETSGGTDTFTGHVYTVEM